MAVDSVNNSVKFSAAQNSQNKTVNTQNTVKNSQSKSTDAETGMNSQVQEGGTLQPTDERIKSAVKIANNQMKHTNTRCEFRYHEETNRVSIKVIDKDTDEVLREIPPEETLEMVEKMWELAGILVDERR